MALSELHERVRDMTRSLADDVVRQAARLLMRGAARKIDKGEDATRYRAMARCFAGDVAVARSADAVQVFGGSGHIRGFAVERPCRDARITRIHEGTNRVRRMNLAPDLPSEGAAA